MVELKSMNALQLNFPLKIGGIEVCEVQTSLITVGIGKKIPKPLAREIKSVSGMEVPAVGEIKWLDNIFLMWFDHAHIALMGCLPSLKLEAIGAVTDVSDGWFIVDVNGPQVREVLARLTPLDMRESSFTIGMTQRSDLMHMQTSISCIEPNRFRVMVFRSMAQTFIGEITEAIESVTARAREV